MLERMKNKNTKDYTFGECCLYVAMIIAAVFFITAGVVLFIFTMADGNLVDLALFAPCILLGAISCAGLMYISNAEV